MQKPEVVFKVLFEQQKNRVYNTVLSLLQNAADAEDVTQEVFVKVFEEFEQFRGEAQLQTWIYRIAVNKSLDFLRAQKAKKRSGILVRLFGDDKNDSALDIPDFVHPGVVLERKEQSKILFKAIDQLPEAQKSVFVLAKLEGLSYLEIAQVLNTTVPSVESLLFRARTNLKKQLINFDGKN